MTFNEDIFKKINELINNLPFDIYKENKDLIFDIINEVSDLLKDNTDLRCDNELLTSYADINEDLYNLDMADCDLNEYHSLYGDGDQQEDCDEDLDDEDEDDIDDDDWCDSLKNGTLSFNKFEPITKDNVDFNLEPTILKHLVKFLYCGADDLEESDFLKVQVLAECGDDTAYVMTKYVPTGRAYCNSTASDYYYIQEQLGLVYNGRHRYSISGPLLDKQYKSVMCEVYEVASRDEISYSLNYQLTFKNF